MNKFNIWLTPIVCLLLLSGCNMQEADQFNFHYKYDQQGQAGSDNQPGHSAGSTEEQQTARDEDDIIPKVIEFVELEPEAGETLTAARVRSLNRYGAELLKSRDEQILQGFRRRGVNGERLSSCYRIQVDGASGFNEKRFYSYNLKDNKDLQLLKAQVENAAEFLYRFHDDANGYANRFFDTLTITPEDVIDRELDLRGRTLYVGMPSFFWQLRLADAFNIRELWAQGVHQENALPGASKIWPMIDPVSEKRIQLREGFRDTASFVSARLDDVLNASNEKEARANLRDIINSNVMDNYEQADGSKFKVNILDGIENMHQQQLQDVAASWQEFLDDSENWEGMAEAVTAVHQAAANNVYDLDIEQNGMVLVGNFHNILVDVSLYLPRNRSFLNYVTVERVDQSIKVRQNGMVCVYTIDNVEVNVAVAADCGMETAGLKYAVDRL